MAMHISATHRSACGLLVLTILAASALPGCTPEVAIRSPTISSLEQVTAAALAYAAAHDDRLPPAHSWPQALVTEQNLPESALINPNPADRTGSRMFAMNAKLSSVARTAISRPDKTVLFFECSNGAPQFGGPELLPMVPRQQEGLAVAFADGHVEFVPLGTAKNLRWEP
jgi:prepilin-type processing-associated H-X9-DG protein